VDTNHDWTRSQLPRGVRDAVTVRRSSRPGSTSAVSELRLLVRTGGKAYLPPDTFYFFPEPPIFKADAEIAHILALVGSAERKLAFGFASIFGIEQMAVLLPYDGEDVIHKYSVDVLAGSEASVAIEVAALNALSWGPTHGPDESAFEALKPRVLRVFEIADGRISRGSRGSDPK
jgi:hypothetical protein